MIRGSCLCGGVRFEAERASGPFEQCHCPRCRRVSGSAFLATVGVHAEGLRFLRGRELVERFALPLRDRPPPYATCFCRRCGSPLPDPEQREGTAEVPAGLLDDDPGLRPERHILVEHRAPWHAIADGLPRLDRPALDALRRRAAREEER